MKKLLAGIGIAVAVLAASGCKDDSSAFIGHWVEQHDPAKVKRPRLLDITQEEGVVFVTEQTALLVEYQLYRGVGTPVSKSAMNIRNGTQLLRLENGKLLYMNRTYLNTPNRS